MILVTDKNGCTYELRIRPPVGLNQHIAEQTIKGMLDAAPREMFNAPTSIELNPEKV
ncbi:MAG: hypothetical protein U1E51_16210 [Candidatus Binatia bacterium]|nr:hypothetical protein [Candidatus Binatia bacterium]